MRYRALIILLILLPLPLAYSEPAKLWSYTDTCAVFSMAINDDGFISLAFGYYAELLSPNGSLIMKAPTRGIAYTTALSTHNVVVIGTEGNWIQTFSPTGKILWEYHARNNVVSVAISKDGKIVAAGDASGYLYLFKNGKLLWKQHVGDYVWKVALSNESILVGTDKGISALSISGALKWSKKLPGGVREIIPTKYGIATLTVPENENWGEIALLKNNGTTIWQVNFSRYVRKIASDGKNLAVAGMIGNVTLISLKSGKRIYSTPFAMYANDVGTLNGYTIVSGGRISQLIGPNGSVVWFEKFNGTVYHVAFSPKGYFLTEYGSHDIQNCYSNITAWKLSGSALTTTTQPKEGSRITFNPLIGVILVIAVIFLGVLLWHERQ